MSHTKSSWIDLSQRAPSPGQFVRVEVTERVGKHTLEFEGQARYDRNGGWLSADGNRYLGAEQEIRRWKPLLDGSGREEWDDFVGELLRD